VQADVVIWYRGASYQLGRSPQGYGLWPAGTGAERPLAVWPGTPAGWAAAWSHFTAAEVPGTIVHLSEPRPAVAGASQAGAVILLAAGVACGIGSLFPGYLAGAALAGQAAQLLPHVLYLAAWALSGLLILSGGPRRRAGALLGLGTGILTFGFFFADFGTVFADGSHVLGPGLVLAVTGWLACTAGAWFGLRGTVAGAPRRPGRGNAARVALSVAAALGAAVTFAPSWDSFTLRAHGGLAQTVTAGNSFANPAPVIAGDLAVMAALVVVVAAAALWRPARLGAALLAGAAIPMAAQAVSALVQLTEPVSPAAFGFSPARAAAAGLTVSSGLTPVFWVYCGFVVALALIGAWMLVPERRAVLPPAWAGASAGVPGMPLAQPAAGGPAADGGEAAGGRLAGS